MRHKAFSQYFYITLHECSINSIWMQVYNQLIWIAHGKQGYLETKKKSPGALLTPTLTLDPLEGPYKVRVVLLLKCLRHCYEDLKIGLSAA